MSATMSAESSRHPNARNQSTPYVVDGQTIIGLTTSWGFLLSSSEISLLY